MSLPEQHKAIILSSNQSPLDLSVQLIPTPKPTPGSAIVRVLSTYIFPYVADIFTSKRRLLSPIVVPITPGNGAIGRVASVGPDAVSLKEGDFVLIDPNVRARDDPSVTMLPGFMILEPRAQKLMDDEWRNGSYAEYARFPLENLFPLSEKILVEKMSYSTYELNFMTTLIVPFGGLTDIDVKPGETVIVAPATGLFGGSAVPMALAMGARVIAAGRNKERLESMKNNFGTAYGDRLDIVTLVGDVAKDAEALRKATPDGQGADAYVDFSPPAAAGSTHIKSCIMVLKNGGRATFMGGIHGDVSIPYFLVMAKSIRIHGKLMYDRATVVRLIGMAEAGLLKLGKEGGLKVAGSYGLDEIETALEVAAKYPEFGRAVFLAP
ncbi:hypothetical protein FRC14_003874 [Serendipita sp. 396]|nr:hypothetical protein FRC14_003874 [Serendipita sp. 396]KAG8789479.1 hypothetical protein FRC15_008336 [Serendipita sp. 397]KAG8804711.1 hypothetical protein FRC16_003601 [Serendipita sp. 398]KAG8879065.1 hypothetical protein FRC20_003824 [Serendipita sp. 405]